MMRGAIRRVPDVAALLEMSCGELHELAATSPTLYRRKKEPKANGGFRIISAPREDLKRMQRAMHAELFPLIFPSPTAWQVTNARRGAAVHRGQPTIIKMDISAAFPSTSTAMVREALGRTRLDEPARRLVARLCTDRGCLPQGSPASNRLLDEVLRLVDHRIGSAADSAGVTYRRYADDFVLSGQSGVFALADSLTEHARRIGYRMSPDKRIVGGEGIPVEITGVIVDGFDMHTTPKFKAKVDAALRDHRSSPSKSTLGRLAGALGWVNEIDDSAAEAAAIRRALNA